MTKRLRWRNPIPSKTRPAPVAPRPIPATVTVRPEVLRAVTDAAAVSGRNETGGPLIGMVQRSWDTPNGRLVVSVLATMPPAPGMQAGPASIALGRASDGERAASALEWWRTVTGFDLVHLGDWHKHPSGMPRPSSGDSATARVMAHETATPIWLTAVAVSDHRRDEQMNADGNLAWASEQIEDQAELRMYRADGAGALVPVRLRIEADAIPALPRLPWHLADPLRFATECRLLDAAGFRVALDDGADGRPPRMIVRASHNGQAPLIVRTAARHPFDAPVVLDKHGRMVANGRGWSPDRFLVDIVTGATR
jgi:hypothetical protein